MGGSRQGSRGRDLIWGGMFIVAGLVFLFGRVDVELARIWTWWPVILVAAGLVKIVVPGNRHEIGAGVLDVLAGLWFLACFQHWYGFKFWTTWPLLLVFFGLKTIIDALVERSKRSAEKEAAHA